MSYNNEAVQTTCVSIPDLLPYAKHSFNVSMNSSRKIIEDQYAYSEGKMNSAVSQILFQSPYDPPHPNSNHHKDLSPGLISPPTRACYTFLKTYATKNETAVGKCSEPFLQRVMDYRELLQLALKLAFDRLENENNAAENCESWFDATFLGNSIAVIRLYRIEQRSRGIVEEAMLNFGALANNAKNVVNAWIPEAGRCTVANDTLETALQWYIACEYSIKPNRVSDLIKL